MRTIATILELPNVPAVYALYGRPDANARAAYVGKAQKLKERITQHLIRHDSSITTGAQIVSLNPDLVAKVLWWEHEDFSDTDQLVAAEEVAFTILDPILRSQSKISERARQFYQAEAFHQRMTGVFQGLPTGCLLITTFQDALKRLTILDQRVAELERRLDQLQRER